MIGSQAAVALLQFSGQSVPLGGRTTSTRLVTVIRSPLIATSHRGLLGTSQSDARQTSNTTVTEVASPAGDKQTAPLFSYVVVVLVLGLESSPHAPRAIAMSVMRCGRYMKNSRRIESYMKLMS
jgi:hypothetical protein